MAVRVTNPAAVELEQTVLRKLRGSFVEVALRMLAQLFAGHPDHTVVGWAP